MKSEKTPVGVYSYGGSWYNLINYIEAGSFESLNHLDDVLKYDSSYTLEAWEIKVEEIFNNDCNE